VDLSEFSAFCVVFCFLRSFPALRYGDMVAHDLLWEGAQASAGNLAARWVNAVGRQVCCNTLGFCCCWQQAGRGIFVLSAVCWTPSIVFALFTLLALCVCPFLQLTGWR
jgi:hypothetical protein